MTDLTDTLPVTPGERFRIVTDGEQWECVLAESGRAFCGYEPVDAVQPVPPHAMLLVFAVILSASVWAAWGAAWRRGDSGVGGAR